MIRYALVCEKGHDFESWFADSAAYDKQVKRKLIACPHCGSAKVEKAIMAPRLAGSRKREAPAEPRLPRPRPQAPEKAPVAMISPQEQEFAASSRNCATTSPRTPTMSGRNSPRKRARCTTARPSTARSTARPRPRKPRRLAEEGIEFHPLPILPDERN